jgi:hypothetical protein
MRIFLFYFLEFPLEPEPLAIKVPNPGAWSNFAPYGNMGYSVPVKPTVGCVEVDSAVIDFRFFDSK